MMQITEKSSSLAELATGAFARISSVELNGLLRRRVLDLGIIPGTQVQCVRRSPTGDPIAFKVRDTIIALRCDDANLIKVYSM